MRDLCLRQAVERDLDQVLDFYGENATEMLPAPLTKDVGDAVSGGHLLVVEDHATRKILACSGTFTISPKKAGFVGELAGTRTKAEIGGVEPVSIQQLMIALRLLACMMGEGEAGANSSGLSLVTFVARANARSIANIEAAGFELLEPIPAWMIYDARTWQAHPGGGSWLTYYATVETCRRALACLGDHGVLRGHVFLQRTRRCDSVVEQFRLLIDIFFVRLAATSSDPIADLIDPLQISSPPSTINLGPSAR